MGDDNKTTTVPWWQDLNGDGIADYRQAWFQRAALWTASRILNAFKPHTWAGRAGAELERNRSTIEQFARDF